MEHEQIAELRACDWALDMQAMLEEFTIVLEWNGEPEDSKPEFEWITISLGFPASWANVEYSQMWQHSPNDNDDRLISVQNYTGDKTHHSEVTLNLESYPTGCMRTIITAQSDSIEVIGQKTPSLESHSSRPRPSEWWLRYFTQKQ